MDSWKKLVAENSATKILRIESPIVYLMLRGAGLWAICFLGAQVIGHALLQDKYQMDSLLEILKSGREWDWDWNNKGDFVGYSGRGGALEISIKISRHLKGSNQLSTDLLFTEIMADN